MASSLAVQSSIRVVKSFERTKLLLSIYESCKHREKPAEDAEAITRTIVANLVKASVGGIIDKHAIHAETVLVLGRFDPAAATMYAAYHKK